MIAHLAVDRRFDDRFVRRLVSEPGDVVQEVGGGGGQAPGEERFGDREAISQRDVVEAPLRERGQPPHERAREGEGDRGRNERETRRERHAGRRW